jgi:hypothetical protein
VCAPLAIVSVGHATSYGAVVSAAPSGAPSSANETLVTPMSSDAVALMVTVPLTVVPLAGLLSATVGAVVSFNTATLIVLVDSCPAASRAVTLSVCAPFAIVSVGHAIS